MHTQYQYEILFINLPFHMSIFTSFQYFIQTLKIASTGSICMVTMVTSFIHLLPGPFINI